MRQLLVVVLLASLPLLQACTGCSSKGGSPEQIRQSTANATAAIKEDTKAVAQGIKEGLTKPKTVDINSASQSELTELPGVNSALAGKIIAARPYDNPDQLVTRRVLSQTEYDKLSNRVTVSKK